MKFPPTLSVMSPPLPPSPPRLSAWIEPPAWISRFPVTWIAIGHALAGVARVVARDRAAVRDRQIADDLEDAVCRAVGEIGLSETLSVVPIVTSPTERLSRRALLHGNRRAGLRPRGILWLRPGGRPEPLSPRAGRMRSREPGSPTQRFIVLSLLRICGRPMNPTRAGD